MKRGGYFLILLLLSAPIDDTWVIDSVLSSPSMPDDDDEYLPREQEKCEQEPVTCQRQPFVYAHADYSAPVSGDLSGKPFSGENLTSPFDRPLVYVFMSLQC